MPCLNSVKMQLYLETLFAQQTEFCKSHSLDLTTLLFLNYIRHEFSSIKIQKLIVRPSRVGFSCPTLDVHVYTTCTLYVGVHHMHPE